MLHNRVSALDHHQDTRIDLNKKQEKSRKVHSTNSKNHNTNSLAKSIIHVNPYYSPLK